MKYFNIKIPFYAKLALILLSLTLITIFFYVGQNILVPLLLSLLFAILLRPIVVFFNKKIHIPHIISVLISVALFIIFIGSIILFISWQTSELTNDWGKIKNNFSMYSRHILHWVKQHYNISYNKQQNFAQRIADNTLNKDTKLLGNTFNFFKNTIFKTILIPIYTFLILLYRNLFIKFLIKIVGRKNEQTLLDILTRIKVVIQSYIIGLLIEGSIVALLTTGGLILLGIQYAVLLGVITAILNLIPYIGILAACLITLLVTLINSTNISVMLGVIALSVIVQFIDNNLLVPKIVGNKVSINALVSIVGVIVGGTIAGIPGMFLAIPLIAILKVIFDRIEFLEPWGFLMGDDLPKTYDWYKLKFPDFSQGNSEDTWTEQTSDDRRDNNTINTRKLK